ncbi:MAG: hypothetical protein ACE5I9_09740 [Candidatus Methylomirabilales bacterium]
MGDFDDNWEYEYEEELEEWPRDTKIDEAKEVLLAELFERRPKEVFFGRQVAVRFEARFFHWITVKALNEMAEEGKIESKEVEFEGAKKIRFYWSKKNRYWKRQTQNARKLILNMAS